MRNRPLFLLLAVVVTACASSTPNTLRYGDGSVTPSSTHHARDGARKKAERAADQDHAIPGYSGRPHYGSDPGDARTAYYDHAAVGSAAAAYLRAAPAKKLIVEVDAVEGRAPQRSSLEHLKRIMERELSKPGGITVEVDDQIADDRDAWSFDDIEALERRYRDHDSSGDTVTMWLIFLSGHLDEEADTLGVAIDATSAVLFPDRIRASATALVQSGAIERAVVTHEAGHLLGLVNLAVKSRYDHEDADHPGHSRYEDSVMYWVIEDTSIAALLSGGPPSDFDRFDRADLAAIRRG